MWVRNDGIQKQYNVGGRVIEIPRGISEHDRCYSLERLVEKHPDLSETDAPIQEQPTPEPAKKKSKKKPVQEEVEEKTADSEVTADEDDN